MVASRVAPPDDPALVRQRGLCRSLRDALEAIPGAAPAVGQDVVAVHPGADRGG